VNISIFIVDSSRPSAINNNNWCVRPTNYFIFAITVTHQDV